MANCLFSCLSSSSRICSSCWAIWRSSASLGGENLPERGYWMISVQICGCSWSHQVRDSNFVGPESPTLGASESSCVAWPLDRKLRWMFIRRTDLTLAWGPEQGCDLILRILPPSVRYWGHLDSHELALKSLFHFHLGFGSSRQVTGEEGLQPAEQSMAWSAGPPHSHCHEWQSPSKRKSLGENDAPFLKGHTPKVSNKAHEELYLPSRLRGILGVESAGDSLRE